MGEGIMHLRMEVCQPHRNMILEPSLTIARVYFTK